jgi:hypothetical protein
VLHKMWGNSCWLLCVDPSGEIDAQTSRSVLENAVPFGQPRNRTRPQLLTTNTTLVLENVSVLRIFGGVSLLFTERNVKAVYPGNAPDSHPSDPRLLQAINRQPNLAYAST